MNIKIKNRKFSFLLVIIGFIFSVTNVFSQAPIPEGERWKDLTGDSLYIGGVIGWGNYFPLADMSQWKVDSRDVFLRECNGGNSLCYPFATWIGPYEYDFDRFNDAASWLHDNNIFQSAHTLGGGGHYYADWLNNGSFTNEELENMLHEFIKNIIQSNGNDVKVNAWNVVNEALAGDIETMVWRPSPFQQLGWEPDESGLTGDDKVFSEVPVYIRKSFEFARMYTDKKLEYRDNNFQESHFKNTRQVYQLMKHLKNKGVPVDVVGFQAHGNIDNKYNWNDFKNQVRKFLDLGYEVWVQELDAANDGTEEDRLRQREFIYNAVRACREAGVTFINFWVMRDGVGNANPFRGWFDIADYGPKPSYYGIQDALAADLSQDVTNETIYKLIADAHVRSDQPDKNEGTRGLLTVRYNSGEGTQYRSLLRFDLFGLAEKVITDIKLRLKVARTPTVGHFDIKKITGEWSETEVTWNNQPTSDTTVYGSYTPATAPAQNKWVSIDLDTSLISGDGYLDIMLYPIGSGSTDPLTFYGLESPNDPDLVVTYEGDVITSISDDKITAEPTLVREFRLEQNYPNPFNPRTMINYQLPMNNEVELSIYNILGQKVVTLVNQHMSAGNHQVEWDASGYASGIYFYLLRAGSFSEMKKMIFLR